jgi:hypothetical protein
VRVGQEVLIRFPGLPPSRFGRLKGEVSLIPADYSIVFGSIPAFIVEAMLPEPWLLSPIGERVNLHAGMGARGSIITEQGTVMQMVLKKLDFLNP